MNEIIRELGRVVSEGFYDHQQIRIAEMNRVRDVLRKKNEGIAFDEVEEKKEKKTYDEKYKDENLSGLLEQMLIEQKITQEEHDYINNVIILHREALKNEDKYEKLMGQFVSQEKAYTEFLKHVRGIGMILSANIIKSFGYCEKYNHVSSLWKHCGLHVVAGKAPKKVKGQKLDFNPKLRTMCWKIGDSFVKSRSPYREFYDSEKIRQLALMENKAEGAPASKMHAELRSRRKMVKIFLQHYYVISRKLVGLESELPYPQDRMGHTNYIDPFKFLNKMKMP